MITIVLHDGGDGSPGVMCVRKWWKREKSVEPRNRGSGELMGDIIGAHIRST